MQKSQFSAKFLSFLHVQLKMFHLQQNSQNYYHDHFKEFVREAHLKKHQESNVCLKNCIVICSYCEAGFITPEKLKIHLKKFNCKKRYKCNHCDEYFRLEKLLLSHYENTHT